MKHAYQHCQMGNIGLALETMLNWIEDIKSNNEQE